MDIQTNQCSIRRSCTHRFDPLISIWSTLCVLCCQMRGPMRVSGLAMGMGLGMVMALVAIMFICLIAPVQTHAMEYEFDDDALLEMDELGDVPSLDVASGPVPLGPKEPMRKEGPGMAIPIPTPADMESALSKPLPAGPAEPFRKENQAAPLPEDADVAGKGKAKGKGKEEQKSSSSSSFMEASSEHANGAAAAWDMDLTPSELWSDSILDFIPVPTFVQKALAAEEKIIATLFPKPSLEGWSYSAGAAVQAVKNAASRLFSSSSSSASSSSKKLAASSYAYTPSGAAKCGFAQSGLCQNRRTKRCALGGTYHPGLCPGNRDNQCCMPRACGSGGFCKYTSQGCTGGTFRAGLCPGPANVQCCQPTTYTPPSPTHPVPPVTSATCPDYAGQPTFNLNGNGNQTFTVTKILPKHLSVPAIYDVDPTQKDNTMLITTACAFARMATAAAKDHIPLKVNSGFRTLVRQQYFWNCYQTGKCNKGRLAAHPGRSNHGVGIAVDINVSPSEDIYNWLAAHAHDYGFVRTVSREKWHWEYRPGAPKSSFT